MTREETIRNHRKMWNWLADNPGKTKQEYLEEFDPKAKLMSNCYLCEYDEQNGDYCRRCPLEWPTDFCYGGGLYAQWSRATYYKWYTSAAEIARQIAELPEKEEKE